MGDLNPSWPHAPGRAGLATEGLHSRLVLGSRPPSVEDVLQDGSCGEHRSLTQSESDPPVDVYLPGNGRAVGVGGALPTCCTHSSGSRHQGVWRGCRLCLTAGSLPGRGGVLQRWGGMGTHLPGTRAPALSQWAE